MDGWIGEIRGFAGTFAPMNWMYCQGQQIAIQQNNALYAIIGCYYGGDYQTYFNLPNLAGKVPVGYGQLAGTSSIYQLASFGGAQNHVISYSEMPAHTHTAQTTGGTASIGGTATAVMNVNSDEAEGKTPTGQYLSVSSSPDIYAGSPTSGAKLAAGAISVNTSGLSVNVSGMNIQIGGAGASASVSLMQPYLVLNWIICVSGYFPSRP